MNVELLEVHGTDLSVVNAARVSLNKWHDEFVTDAKAAALKSRAEACYELDCELYEETSWFQRIFAQKPRQQPSPASDEKLLSYLARSGHESPFFHVGMSLRVTAPIFVARQLMRHQIGLATNEVSRRYVNDLPSTWSPRAWREAVAGVKQGSGGKVATWREVAATAIYGASTGIAVGVYRLLLALGVCNEQARAVLPQAMYTTWIWTGSLAAFARVCRLRLSTDAQLEVAEIARGIDGIACTAFPYAWDALNHAA
jgi:thymidylate synthase (FAD)